MRLLEACVAYILSGFQIFPKECQFNQKKLQNSNAKIDVTGQVHPRQSSSRLSAVQTSRISGHRRQALQGFLLSTLLLGLPWAMNEGDTQNPSSGEARHANRRGSCQKIIIVCKLLQTIRPSKNHCIFYSLSSTTCQMVYIIHVLEVNCCKIGSNLLLLSRLRMTNGTTNISETQPRHLC